MAKNRKKRFILLAVLIVLIALQFMPVDRTIPNYEGGQDLIDLTQPTAEVEGMLRTACYDCHSYETTYPWYGYIWPVSGWLQGHIDHARQKVNFSIFGLETRMKANDKLQEAAEEVREKHMPISSYLRMHGDARLSDEQRATLADWFMSLRK